MSPNNWRIFIVLLSISSITQAADIICYYGSQDNGTAVPLKDAASILNNTACFNPNRPTISITLGYSVIEKEFKLRFPVIQALLDLNQYNVLLMNWEKESNAYVPVASQVGVNYPAVVLLARGVGKDYGNAIVSMTKAGLDISNLICVGHSLGAHLIGYAAQEVNAAGLKIKRVVGLDPAGPLIITDRLSKSAAELVHTLHTDWGLYGMNASLAHVDIWENYNYYEKNKVQPNCDKNTIPAVGNDSFCSHTFAWQLFLESILYTNSTQASKASSPSAWYSSNETTDVINFGISIDPSARGNYYACTDAEEPYVKGVHGIVPDECLT